MDSNLIIYSSGTNKHTAIFTYAGEVRFGPPYYDLEIDGRKIVWRCFSEYPVWSENERFLALEGWPRYIRVPVKGRGRIKLRKPQPSNPYPSDPVTAN